MAAPNAYMNPAANSYGQNPQGRPQQPWIKRHGKTIIYGTAIGAGVLAIGAVGYVIYEALVGGAQPPACVAQEQQLYSLQQEMLAIYQQAAAQGGTFTDSQSNEVQSLQNSISNTIHNLSETCIASPGATLTKTIDQIIAYGLWFAAGIVGLVVSVYFVRWAVSRWGGGKADPDGPPKSPSDADPPDDFQGGATGGSDLANGEVAAEYENGTIDGDQAQTAAANLASSDPAIAIDDTVASDYSTWASTASEDAAVLLDALADLWDALVTLLQDAYEALLAFLGLA